MRSQGDTSTASFNIHRRGGNQNKKTLKPLGEEATKKPLGSGSVKGDPGKNARFATHEQFFRGHGVGLTIE